MHQPSRDNTESIKARVAALGPWFHNLDLQGVRTAEDHFLGDYPQVKYDSFRESLPRDMRGLSVLDIGCNAGFYSMEMKRRGADRVVGIDSDDRYLEQARFASSVCNLSIDFLRMTIWDIAALKERFDLVIFMGVFYHLRHPLLALDLIHEHVAKDLLLFQSMQRGSRLIDFIAEDYDFKEVEVFNTASFPAMYFIERSYSHDETNWWIPNRPGMEAMLRSAGFEIEGRPEDEVYLCRRKVIAVPPDGPHSVYPSSNLTLRSNE